MFFVSPNSKAGRGAVIALPSIGSRRWCSRVFHAVALALALPSLAVAQTNGTWNVDGNGTWSTTTNWLGGTVASGTNAAANFANVNLTTARTITVNGNYTIGSMNVGDTDASGPTLETYTFSSGTLTLANTTGAPTINVALGSATGQRRVNFNTVLAGTSGLTVTQSGAGTGGFASIGLKGINTFTGNITIGNGTYAKELYLDIGNNAASGEAAQLGAGNFAGNIDIQGNNLLRFFSTLNNTLSGTISGGTGARIQLYAGTGTTTLSAANTFSGGLSVISTPAAQSVLNLGNANALQSGQLQLLGTNALRFSPSIGTFNVGRMNGAGNFALTATDNSAVTLSIGNAGAGVNDTISGTISGLGGLTKVGSGTLTLSAANTYSGTTTLSGGVLSLNNASALGGGGNLTFSGGSLQYTSANQADYASRIVSSGSAISIDTNSQDVTWTGGLASSNQGGLTKFGAGRLTLAANNSYTGLTTVSTGTLQIGNGGTTGSVGGAIANNAALVFNRSNDLVQSGSIFGTGSVTKQGAGTLSLTGGLGFSGGLTVSAGTLAISNNSSSTSVGTLTVGAASALPRVSVSSGTFSFGSASNSPLGLNAGERGAMTISGGSVSQAGSGRFDIGSGGAGVVEQTGGSASYTQLVTAISAYGAYLISGGTATLGGSGLVSIGNQGSGLFQQTGGSVLVTNSNSVRGFMIAAGGNAYGVVDIQSGTLTANATSGFMRVGGAVTSGNMTGVLTIRDTGYVQVQSTFQVTAGTSTTTPTGIVNLIGGTLETREITKVANANARATLNADGGTLKVFTTNSGASFLQGLDNAFIYSKGLTVDTSGQSVTIGQALAAPAGFGVLASGSTLSVASGGSGYIAPPLVTFAAPSGGGVRATGLATIDANGTVTGITITSPGSGYTSGESVAVSFNQGGNASGAALTAATGFNATASQANVSGGLTKTGAGTLRLSGANTYTGATTIASGTLALGAGGSFANSSSIIVGNAGSSGAVLDLTAKTGSFDIGAGQTLGGGGTVQLAASGTLNVLGFLSPGNSPGLLTFDAGTTLLSGTTLMEVWGTSRATDPSHGTGFYDAINVVDSGVLTFGGLLQLAFNQEFADDSTFNLFSTSGGGSLAGNFTGVDVTGSFYSGLSWSQSGSKWTSSNTTGGQSLEFNAATGTLVIVPEPGALALAAVGVAAAAWVARRRRS